MNYFYKSWTILTFFFMFPGLNSHAQSVTLTGKQFYLNEQKFYPMVMNYGLNGVINGNNYFMAGDHNYNATNNYECANMLTCSGIVQSHFNIIAGMGFNTIRVCGMGPSYISGTGLVLSCKKYNFVHGGNDNNVNLSINPDNPNDPGMLTLLSLYDKVLELAASASPHPLQVILLMKGDVTPLDATEMDLRAVFLGKVADHLKNSPYKNVLV